MGSRYQGPQDFDHARALKVGVLLANLGTPAAPDPASVRRYLAEFLWDPRVVEVPRVLWWTILHGIILRVRPARSARAYASVWTPEGSPLMVNARAQGEALQRALDEREPGLFRVVLAMRYGKPDIASALDELLAQGVGRLLILPAYPQYSGTTTGSVFDAVSGVLRARRWVPDLAFRSSYHDDPGYVAAVAASIRDHWKDHGEPDRLLFSFHGIPRRYFRSGDPYHCHCQKTARLVSEAIGIDGDRWRVSFQSRVGREEWLRPYTDETLEQWGRDGIGSVHVVCPGFSADCLETLEEIAVENRDRFLQAGGGAFHYIPALNTRPDHVSALRDLVLADTGAWLPWARDEARLATNPAPRRRQLAQAMGAQR
jgi:ferrochelatase